MNRTLSPNGLLLLKNFEKCRLVAYKDSGGVWTIGWGHTGPHIGEGLACTRQQADLWLKNDSGCAQAAINRLVLVPITQNQFDALVSLVFNIGIEAFSASTLLAKINAGRSEAAAAQFERWNHDNGVVVAGLVTRRAAERTLFLAPD